MNTSTSIITDWIWVTYSSAKVTIACIHQPTSLTLQTFKMLWCLYSDLQWAKNTPWQLLQLSWAGVTQQVTVIWLFAASSIHTLPHRFHIKPPAMGRGGDKRKKQKRAFEESHPCSWP